MNAPAANNGPLPGGIGELSLTCREASRLQSEAMDHPLTARQRIGLRIHLFLCQRCRRYGRQLRFLRGLAREQAERDEALPAQTLSPEARERMKQRLRAGS